MRLAAIQEALAVVQGCAKALQERVHEQVSTVVSACLKAVFGPTAYEFTIVFEEKRGKTEARPVFLRDGVEVNPVNAAGGGVVDVAAFALRLVTLVVTKPRPRKIMILDEPFRYVSKEYREPVRALLEKVSNDFEVQIVMVTHVSELKIGEVVELP